MKRLLIAPTIILMLASPACAVDPPKNLRPAHVHTSICTIESRDAVAGVVYVRMSPEYCEATDYAVEIAAQAMYDILVSLPEVYEYIQVVNPCELKDKFTLNELETILRELEVK